MSIFISHISKEAQLALTFKKWFTKALEENYKVFVSSEATDIPPGARWIDHIETAINDSKILLILCSKESIKNPWINFEAGCGWIKRKAVIPILHSDLNPDELPLPLSSLQLLDMRKEDFLQKLINTLPKDIVKEDLSCISLSEMKIDLSNAIISLKPKVLGTILFKSNSPNEDGWKFELKEKPGLNSVFSTLIDGYWGKVLKINLPNGDWMDHKSINSEMQIKLIEFIIRPGNSWAFYSKIEIISGNEEISKKVWLKFQVGLDDPIPVGDSEWLVFHSPEKLNGNWLKFKINLSNEVQRTFGLEGWKYKKLIGFRIRNDLTIAKIELLG